MVIKGDNQTLYTKTFGKNTNMNILYYDQYVTIQNNWIICLFFPLETQMTLFMHTMGTKTRKAFSTKFAQIRFFTSMSVSMIMKFEFVCKSFTTEFTIELFHWWIDAMLSLHMSVHMFSSNHFSTQCAWNFVVNTIYVVICCKKIKSYLFLMNFYVHPSHSRFSNEYIRKLLKGKLSKKKLF